MYLGNTAYDMPKNYYFGGGGDTFITPLAAVSLAAVFILTNTLKRQNVIVAFLLGSMLLPFDINVNLGSLHFPALRFLIAAGWLRQFTRGDIPLPRLTLLDKVFLASALISSVAFILLWGGASAIANRIGFLWNTLGSYFLIRSLIRDEEDVLQAIRAFALIVIVIAPCMLVEHLTRFDSFFILGAPQLADIREGAVRAKGPFSHAITAGTIGAMLLPVFVGAFWSRQKRRILFLLAAVACGTIVISSASSTPILASACGILGILLWPQRQNLRLFRRMLVVILALLQLVMKAPVWFLIAKIGGSMGGSGYHRAMLIDNFVRHFTEWWLVGTQANASWGYDMWDVDDAYVAAGVGGGLITFILFIAILVLAYKQVGRSRKRLSTSPRQARLVWALGASLLANTIGFFGIVYFDQSAVAWYTLLATISATAAFIAQDIEAKTRSPLFALELDTTPLDELAHQFTCECI